MLQYLHQMTNQLQTLQDRLPPANPAPVPAPAPASSSAAPAPPLSRDVITPTPEHYSGELEKSKGFLLQCALAFRRSLRSFPDDGSKIYFLVGLLRDRALRWAETVVDEENLIYYSYEEFFDLFKQTFCPNYNGTIGTKTQNSFN
uniref:DUF4939 domain-containing protein n=1 Tax=Xiphophorus couchianus TaxID=32473 RepID=A0A3B5L0M0_9TELE